MATAARGRRRARFDPLRPRLIRVAYRMLGSVADAEDVVQDAFLRWLDADRDAVREPEAYPAPRRHAPLPRPAEIGAAAARNLCRALAAGAGGRGGGGRDRRRHAAADAGARAAVAARARRLPAARRVRRRLRGGRRDDRPRTGGLPPARQPRARACPRRAPALPVPKERGLEIAAAFFSASRSGDMEQLRSLLAADVALYSDGGGKRPAAKRPSSGSTTSCSFRPRSRVSSRADVAAACAMASSTACPASSPSSATAAADHRARDRGRQDRRRSMSCAIRTSSGIWRRGGALTAAHSGARSLSAPGGLGEAAYSAATPNA